jgi:hypothetical protein
MGLLSVVDVLIAAEEYAISVSASLFLSGATVFGGLAAAWLLRLKGATFHLLAGLMALGIVADSAAIAAKLLAPSDWLVGVTWTLAGFYVLAAAVFIFRFDHARAGRVRRMGALALLIGANLAAAALVSMDGAFWLLSAKLRPMLGRESVASALEHPAPNVEQDRLWEAQPALLEAQRATLRAGAPGRVNVYSIGVAGSGTQALFSREAKEALRVAEAHFGDDSRGGLLLSNGAADLTRAPLATQGNIAAAAKAIGQVADTDRDILFVYLASHGSPTAELTSELPGYQPVRPISAASTAEALRGAGVTRRLIVVSACYAGSWIPAFANEDTIVITASAKDRTSFGCDDSRRLTVFGEAFLGSLAAKDVSLRMAFDDAKRKIAALERDQGLTPSQPQAYVGRNMTMLWDGERTPSEP